MAKGISPGLQKLLKEPAYAQIATIMPDGSPQITQVWVDTDGENVLVNTSRGRQKERNIEREPRVAINIVDPKNAWRGATVRGRAALVDEGAFEHIDSLAQKYLEKEKYPFLQPGEQRVIVKITPERVIEMGLDG